MNIRRILKEELYRQYNIDSIINSSLKENINRLILNEAISSVVYHFTGLRKLYNILVSDTFYMQSAFSAQSDDMSNKKFFMSTTRQKSGELGYSRGKRVRITLNGDLLNQRYEGKPVDYWGETMGKYAYFKKKKEGRDIDYYQPSTENEDRVFSNEPEIYDFHKYVKRIDILVENDDDLSVVKKCLHTKFINLIHVYKDNKSFNMQIDKNELEHTDILMNAGDNPNMGTPSRNVETNALSDILSFMMIYDNIPRKDEQKYASMMMKKYNLDKYIRSTLPKLQTNHSLLNFSISNAFNDINRNTNDMQAYANTAKMFRDFLKKNNLKNERDAKIQFKKSIESNYYTNDIDYNKTVKLFVVNKFGNTRIIIPYPEKTSFWDVFGDLRQYFRNMVERHIYSHNSKSDESFTKYLQHLEKNEIPLLKMFEIINSFNMDDEYKQELLDDSTYGYEDMKYNDALYGYNSFINDKQEQEVVNMFKK